MSSTPMIQMLERYLSLSSNRHELIVSNMANVDTPGYHTRDIDFRSEMKRVMSGDSSMAALSPATVPVAGLTERPDGNNVNLDREGLVLAETQMQYQIGVQLVRSEFHRLLSAINEGK